MYKEFFSKCQKQLSDTDFKLVEQDLAVQLPEPFKAVYRVCNGGRPKNTIWQDPEGEWDDIEVRDFLSMRYFKSKADDPNFTIEGIAKNQWNVRKLPPTFLPFAIDWGGNYFCIDHQTGKIYYFVRDVWSENISVEENFKVNTRYITESINNFIDGLQFNDEDDD